MTARTSTHGSCPAGSVTDVQPALTGSCCENVRIGASAIALSTRSRNATSAAMSAHGFPRGEVQPDLVAKGHGCAAWRRWCRERAGRRTGHRRARNRSREHRPRVRARPSLTDQPGRKVDVVPQHDVAIGKRFGAGKKAGETHERKAARLRLVEEGQVALPREPAESALRGRGHQPYPGHEGMIIRNPRRLAASGAHAPRGI